MSHYHHSPHPPLLLHYTLTAAVHDSLLAFVIFCLLFWTKTYVNQNLFLHEYFAIMVMITLLSNILTNYIVKQNYYRTIMDIYLNCYTNLILFSILIYHFSWQSLKMKKIFLRLFEKECTWKLLQFYKIYCMQLCNLSASCNLVWPFMIYIALKR